MKKKNGRIISSTFVSFSSHNVLSTERTDTGDNGNCVVNGRNSGKWTFRNELPRMTSPCICRSAWSPCHFYWTLCQLVPQMQNNEMKLYRFFLRTAKTEAILNNIMVLGHISTQPYKEVYPGSFTVQDKTCHHGLVREPNGLFRHLKWSSNIVGCSS